VHKSLALAQNKDHTILLGELTAQKSKGRHEERATQSHQTKARRITKRGEPVFLYKIQTH